MVVMYRQEYEAVIGLEVHAELQTRSKMFCSCPVVDLTTAAPNSAVCEICSGMPGTLPVINARAVEEAVKVGLALHCTIAHASVFARKNYFYPDLPKGYQISQYDLPLARNGWLQINPPSGQRPTGQHPAGQQKAGPRPVRINRVHLEEDTGKLTHVEGASLVDLNRSGVPLLEIVTEPDLFSVEDVKAYATALRTLLQYLEVNSGSMEKGIIRFEANVSVRPVGSGELGTRTEIKNLNSFHALTHGVAYEIDRQSARLREGLPVEQQTLGWDASAGRTVPQRSKEEAHDYRYFPEPDLPPLVVDDAFISRVRDTLPELPAEKYERFVSEYQLTAYTAAVLTADRASADFYEEALHAAPALIPDKIANWVSGDLFGLLNQAGLSMESCPVQPAGLADLISRVEQGEINNTSAREILAAMLSSGKNAEAIISEKNLAQISSEDVIEGMIRNVLLENPDQAQAYLDGKKSLRQWFFGQVMRSARGRANPAVTDQVLDRLLEALEENHSIE